MIRKITQSIDATKLIVYTLSFIIPIMIGLFAYKKMGIYPFGEESLLSLDLWGQYFPMIVEQYNKRLQFLSTTFSWNGALGFNAFAQSAYYTNSVFNYLLLLFRRENLINALDFLILFKFGLTSLAFTIFLDYKYKTLNTITIACAIAYAFSSYTIAYVSQTMWFDAVIFFPIIMIGLERLIIEKKPVLYSVFLALTIYSSFYISFSICIFLVLYYISLLYIRSEYMSKAEIKASFIYFSLFSLLSGGLAAFVVIPVYQAIQLTLASSLAAPEGLGFYNTLAEYIAKLLPSTKPSIEYGIPNIYSGAFVVFLVPLFFANEDINGKRKVTFLALISFLYLSMNLNVLNYVWHGFHLPNQLPGRWSFIFSFILIMLAYEGLIHLKGITLKGVLISLINVLFVLSLIKSLPLESRVTHQEINFTMIGLCLYAVLTYCAAKTSKINTQELIIASIAICMIVDVGGNAIQLFDRDVRTSTISVYQHADSTMQKIVAKYKSDPQDFYRIEMYEGWTFNPGQLFDYQGISYYSSTMTGDTYHLLKSFGYRVYAENVSTVYNPFSTLMNTLFSVKYIIDKTGVLDLQGYRPIEMIDDYRVLENQYYLPFAFMADKKLLSYRMDQGSPIEKQNAFFNAMMGSDVDVFESLPFDTVKIQNATFSDTVDWDNQYYYRVEQDKPVELSFTYENKKDQHLYVTQNFRAGDMTININGDVQKIDYRQNKMKALGLLKTGDVITVSIVVDGIDVGLWNLELFAFNEDRFALCHQVLLKSVVSEVIFNNTNIQCTVDAGQGGLLYTSIPYDGGWQVQCDGKQLSIHKVGNSLISVLVPKGKHVLEFSYHVPGLLLGRIVSFMSMAMIIIFLRYKKQIALKTVQNTESITADELDDADEVLKI